MDKSLVVGEVCRTAFTGTLSGQRMLGGRSWYLRRPPLVLVHGLWSSSNTWDPVVWREGDPLPPIGGIPPGVIPTGMLTRVYKADYSNNSDGGLNENWDVVPQTILAALAQYRTANDGSPGQHHPMRGFRGVRYAATRADVVGHSMGGLLTRLYVSDYDRAPPAYRERFIDNWIAQDEWEPVQQWGTVNTMRGSDDDYYRSQSSFGAGRIRRFISIGTPFDGSAHADWVLANWQTIATAAKDAEAFEGAMTLYIERGFRGMLRELSAPPPTFVVGWYDPWAHPPRAIIDLGRNSTIQRVLEGRWIEPGTTVVHNVNYPTHNARVRWHPIVGQADFNAPPTFFSSSAWGAAALVPAALLNVPVGEANGSNGDLVVTNSSQANGQLQISTVFPATVHMDFAGMESLGLQSETASREIADFVFRLLVTDRPAEWSGNLK